MRKTVKDMSFLKLNKLAVISVFDFLKYRNKSVNKRQLVLSKHTGQEYSF